ncbi:MAG: hypothetical protein EP329_20240 [Deltaproteobacteria bacterium]|nr:MAG: hypothetical protein EP329_20240 [Deltaproteobacteria bacterium]
MTPPVRDVPGALGGSRILEVPEVAAELAGLRALLGGAGRVLLEVGFDHGRRLTSTASASPDWTVVGLEVRAKRVAEARAWAAENGLDNLHAFRLDARAVLAGALPEASVDVLEALFPTPWPEGKARRRLLVTPDFLADAARVLRPGGLLHVATDVSWYADLMASAIAASDLLAPADPGALTRERPPCPQQSRREWRCERDGIAIARFVLRRR